MKQAPSQKTVRNQVSNIFSNRRVVKRAQAIIKALEAGVDNLLPYFPTAKAEAFRHVSITLKGVLRREGTRKFF